MLRFHDCDDPLCVSLSRDMSYGHHNQQIPTAESALKAGPDAHPPLNMRNALIFNTAIVWAVAFLNLGLKGKQSRRERDEMEARDVEQDKPVLELSSREVTEPTEGA